MSHSLSVNGLSYTRILQKDELVYARYELEWNAYGILTNFNKMINPKKQRLPKILSNFLAAEKKKVQVRLDKIEQIRTTRLEFVKTLPPGQVDQELLDEVMKAADVDYDLNYHWERSHRYTREKLETKADEIDRFGFQIMQMATHEVKAVPDFLKVECTLNPNTTAPRWLPIPINRLLDPSDPSQPIIKQCLPHSAILRELMLIMSDLDQMKNDMEQASA